MKVDVPRLFEDRIKGQADLSNSLKKNIQMELCEQMTTLLTLGSVWAMISSPDLFFKQAITSRVDDREQFKLRARVWV